MNVNQIEILGMLAVTITIIGVYLVAVLHPKGQYFAFTANILWGFYAYLINSYPILIQSVVLGCIALIGIYVWSKKI